MGHSNRSCWAATGSKCAECDFQAPGKPGDEAQREPITCEKNAEERGALAAQHDRGERGQTEWQTPRWSTCAKAAGAQHENCFEWRGKGNQHGMRPVANRLFRSSDNRR